MKKRKKIIEQAENIIENLEEQIKVLEKSINIDKSEKSNNQIKINK